jgi:NADH-quinone oxidoreductase subunit N
MTVPYLEIFRALIAEAMLVVGALFALVLDMGSLRRREAGERRMTVGMLASVTLLATVIPLTQQLGQEPLTLVRGTLLANDLTATFKLVVASLALVTVLISMNFDVGRHVGEYFATVLFGAVGMMLLVSTDDLLVIFVALELTSICLYILTAFHKGALRSQEAAVKYFMFGAIASAFLLFGLSYLYGVTGTTNLPEMQTSFASAAGLRHSALVVVGMLFVIVGFGFKVAVVPFHLWAPDAYEGAPTPVTAYIATGSKVASFFVLAKVAMVGFAGMEGSAFWGRFGSGWTMVLAVVATLSMVLGNCAAIVQRNVKRLLAYSSIAHAGYILIGLVAATSMGAASVLFYVIVYGLTNIGAFGVVATIANHVGGDNMEDFNGMARRAPGLSLLLLIFILSLAGVPPLGGFFGKFYLFAAAVQRDAQTFGLLWLVVLGILMSAVSLYYYLILLKHVYVAAPATEERVTTPNYLALGLTLVALAVVALGVFPDRILVLLNDLVGLL